MPIPLSEIQQEYSDLSQSHCPRPHPRPHPDPKKPPYHPHHLKNRPHHHLIKKKIKFEICKKIEMYFRKYLKSLESEITLTLMQL